MENTPKESEVQEATREEPEAAVEFTTTQDTVTLSVPARYENEITADDSFMIEAPETGEHDLDDVLFSFYDKSQAAEDRLASSGRSARSSLKTRRSWSRTAQTDGSRKILWR